MSHDYLDRRNNTSGSSRNNANEGPAPTHEMLREYLEQRMRRNEMLTAQMFGRDEEEEEKQVKQKVSDEESLQHEAAPGQGTSTSMPAGVRYYTDMNNGIIHEGVVLGNMVDFSDKGSGVQRETSNFIVPKGWGLAKIASHLNVTVQELKELNKDKLKTWGEVQGFNAGEEIFYSLKSNKKEDIKTDPTTLITQANRDYENGLIGMPELARALLPYVSTQADNICGIIDRLDWNEKDNLSYALAFNSPNDVDLEKFDRNLLKAMSSYLDTYLTGSREDNLKQKKRIDKILRKDKTKDDKNVYDKDARDTGIDFVNENKEAYLKGHERWESGTKNNSSYNNILIVNKNKADGNHLKVYRSFSGGVYTLIGKETLNDTKYAEEKALATRQSTYCNIAANKIGLSYGAPNIQNYGGKEHNANAMYNNFVKGLYNTETHEFKEVKFDKAEKYANSGGLAYAIWKNQGGIGHIGTLTGGYGGDGKKTMANLKIFQAGGSFGNMNYSSGFGNNESKFYVWKKK